MASKRAVRVSGVLSLDDVVRAVGVVGRPVLHGYSVCAEKAEIDGIQDEVVAAPSAGVAERDPMPAVGVHGVLVDGHPRDGGETAEQCRPHLRR